MPGVRIFPLLILVLALLIAGCVTGFAQAVPGGGTTFITVNSSSGGEPVTAPIRATSYGAQVLLPGGAWVDCEINCYRTLRTRTVDFFANIERTGGGR